MTLPGRSLSADGSGSAGTTSLSADSKVLSGAGGLWRAISPAARDDDDDDEDSRRASRCCGAPPRGPPLAPSPTRRSASRPKEASQPLTARRPHGWPTPVAPATTTTTCSTSDNDAAPTRGRLRRDAVVRSGRPGRGSGPRVASLNRLDGCGVRLVCHVCMFPSWWRFAAARSAGHGCPY